MCQRKLRNSVWIGRYLHLNFRTRISYSDLNFAPIRFKLGGLSEGVVCKACAKGNCATRSGSDDIYTSTISLHLTISLLGFPTRKTAPIFPIFLTITSRNNSSPLAEGGWLTYRRLGGDRAQKKDLFAHTLGFFPIPISIPILHRSALYLVCRWGMVAPRRVPKEIAQLGQDRKILTCGFPLEDVF